MDELCDVVVGRVGEDVLRGADLDDASVAHHRDAVTEEHRLIEVVGDEDDGLLQFPLQLDELFLHLATDQRVESGEGFVHEEDVGLGRKRAGQADALLHAAGELFGELVAPAFQTNGFEPLVG